MEKVIKPGSSEVGLGVQFNVFSMYSDEGLDKFTLI